MTVKERYAKALAWFAAEMPAPQTELQYDNPFHLLIAVILSAQCTDKRVNMVTPVTEEFSGEVPDNIDDLMRIPGVGRKTANVMLSVVWNRAAMAVDTHVFRVSERIGLTTNSKSPLMTEQALVKNIPEELIPMAHHWLILHGRYVCKARRPDCLNCGLTEICRYYQKENK